MPRTEITGDQILDGSITGKDIEDGSIYRQDLNVTSTGKAVVRKIIAGNDISINYTGADSGTGDVTISFNSSTGGITASQHRTLDQLVHAVAENYYYDVTRVGGTVSKETWWTNSGKTTKIREIDYVYSGGQVYQMITKQYDSGGNIITGETLTETIYRTGSKVDHISAVLS